MATQHKISSELFNEAFEVIALHTNMPIYAVAFFLNKTLGLQLYREEDVVINKASFTNYTWYNYSLDCTYNLLPNQVKTTKPLQNPNANNALFAVSNYVGATYLLSGYKKVDFILKINHESTVNLNQVLKQIKTIAGLSLAYKIEQSTIKTNDSIISLSYAN